MPIRTAVLSDVNGLNNELIADLMMEFAQLEGASMGLNNDQAGSTTTSTGATLGLRGLNSYPGGAGASSAFGTSGTAITNGRHTIATVGATVAGLSKSTLSEMRLALPGQYWNSPATAWMMHPTAIDVLTKAVSSGNVPYFVETGTNNGGSVVKEFGRRHFYLSCRLVKIPDYCRCGRNDSAGDGTNSAGLHYDVCRKAHGINSA
jgi:hypothetical protein